MSVLRTAYIYVRDVLAGTLTEEDSGYVFTYDEKYIASGLPGISLTMPVSSASYESSTLFPFFDNLIPEGWMFEVAIHNWKLNREDRFGALLATCEDCIGCVSVKRELV